jgi:hypothetical protein
MLKRPIMSQLKRNSSEDRLVYINEKQQQFMAARPKRKTYNGGRGSGKSSAKGFKDVQRFYELPRSKFFLAGLTYNQILTKTLPSAEESWRTCGFKEFDRDKRAGHYVIGTKPPHWWPKPYQPPRNYDNTITFCNGYTIEMLSLDRPDSNRGGNYDGGDVDESALVKEEIFNKVLKPMVRGNRYRFNHHLHGELCDYSSAAWLPSGQWIYKTEELQKTKPEKYFFIEATAADNADALPPDYIEELSETLSQLEMDVEVWNKRLKKVPNCFYPALSEAKHCVSNTFSYTQNEAGLWVSSPNFIDPTKPKDSSWDFNAAIVSVLVCQEMGNEFRIDNALFVKQADITLVEAAVDLVCEKYKDHPCKEMNLYGDRNGNSRSPGMTKTFYETICERFAKNGWRAYLKVQGLDSKHRLRHLVINGILSENNTRMPRIRMNQTNCKFLYISMENSPMYNDFEKDKRSEGRLLDQERATHFSDCLDNIAMAKYAHLFGYDSYQPYRVYFLN